MAKFYYKVVLVIENVLFLSSQGWDDLNLSCAHFSDDSGDQSHMQTVTKCTSRLLVFPRKM